MRIRRREKERAETAESGPSADPPHDREGSRPADRVATLNTEPGAASPDTVAPGEPAPAPSPQGNALSSESAQPAQPAQPAETPPATPPATPDGPLSQVDAGVAAPPTQNGPSAPAPSTATAVEAAVAEPVRPDAPTTVPPAAAAEARAGDPVTSAAAPPAVVTEPKPAPEPASAPAAGPPPAKATMRAPSIGNDATELLNGSKPAPRELPRVIAIANQKGGVGKTTTTVNLGAALAELDYRVLVIDLDPQGNATTGLGVEARNFELSMYDVIMRDQPLEDCIEPTSVKNLFVAPATIDLAGVEIELVPAFSRELRLKRAIDTVVDDFDFVLIDCPPSLGLITVNGLAAADEVLVPIQCEYYALEGLSQLLRNVNLVSTNLNQSLEVTTIVLTMFDARTRLSVDVANEVREHFSERVCRSVIPRTVRLSEAPSFGQPITVFDPASRGAVAYRELAKEVSNGAPQRSR
jgi:chromosome partitioning protein